MIKLIKHYMKEQEEKLQLIKSGYQDGDIICLNNEICDSGYMPIQNLQCRSGELCFNCAVIYSNHCDYRTGILEFKNDIDCCICLENKRGVKFPNCNHYICIDDFKRCIYGEERQNELPFPYPELEDDYFMSHGINREKYDTDPVIIKYNEDHNKWDDMYEEKQEKENYLNRCPLCRA